MNEPKTYFVRTYGCQMNELDTQIMVGQLEKRGLTAVTEEEEADLLLYNTCSIRDLAERKVMGKLGHLGKKTKRQLIGITGCMAMAKKDSLFRKFPHLDFIVGTNNITDVNAVLDEVLYTKKQVCKTDNRFEENLDYLSAKRDDPVKAYVSIIRGCDKFCTYCVVPYTRGEEVSRPPSSILEECQKLIDQGFKEITLLGQNVNSYGKDKPEWNCLFHDLLYQIDKMLGPQQRVRFITSHPVDITKELMYAVRDLPSLCEFVHFPLQAGSSRILKKMHRIYTKEEYMDKVALLKSIVPNVSLGTDIIVGFPTETEEEFMETYEAIRTIRYSVGFFYTYSPRKGTPAMRWKDDIPLEIKQDRLQRLMDLQSSIGNELRHEMLGGTYEVLVEKLTKDGKMLKGRTRCWKKVIFEGPESWIGTFQNVKIHSCNHETLIGTVSLEHPLKLRLG